MLRSLVGSEMCIRDRNEELPIALVNWDLQTDINFDSDGFLDNPSTNVTMLLMDKSETRDYSDMIDKSEEIGDLFVQFIQVLNNALRQFNRKGENAVSGANYTIVPKHGAGYHSGVIATFNLKTPIRRCDLPKECK